MFSAAAVPSEATFEAKNTPCVQSKASVTSGTAVARRPPNRMASRATPAGSSHSSAAVGHCDAGTVNRAFGWAAGVSDSGVQSLPSSANRIQQMSSPTVSAFHPGKVGCSIARLVLPQALGNAAAMYFTTPSGEVSFRISMCSASQPSSRAITDAIRSA